MKNWTEKYRPRSLKEIQGQDSAILKLREFLQLKHPVLISGPPGTGKTSVIYALANELGYEVVEINASDQRNKANIEAVVKSAVNQVSLFGKGKLILIDEIDGLAGNKDRGGVQALNKILKEAKQSIVLTANDPYTKKLNSLRKNVKIVDFGSLNYLSITKVLKKIAEKEGIKFSEDDLKSLSRKAGGDLRAAINDLETLSTGDKKIIKKDIENIGDRERKETMFNALMLIFKSKNPEIVRKALDNVDVDYDEAILWLEENIPYEYKKAEDLHNAFESLAKADVYRGRIRRWQYWRFLVYIRDFLTAGISLSKEEKYSGFTKYKRTSRILKIWMANMKNLKRKKISQKLSKELHCSSKRVFRDVIPYLKIIYKKEDLKFNLDEEEVEWLKK